MHIVISTPENDNVEHITTTEDNEVEDREELLGHASIDTTQVYLSTECSAWLARSGAPRTAESPCDL